MDENISLGSFGNVDISFVQGIAKVNLTVASSNIVQASISCDAGALIDALFAAIEAKSSSGAVVVEKSVQAVIKQAVLAL